MNKQETCYKLVHFHRIDDKLYSYLMNFTFCHSDNPFVFEYEIGVTAHEQNESLPIYAFESRQTALSWLLNTDSYGEELSQMFFSAQKRQAHNIETIKLLKCHYIPSTNGAFDFYDFTDIIYGYTEKGFSIGLPPTGTVLAKSLTPISLELS